VREAPAAMTQQPLQRPQHISDASRTTEPHLGKAEAEEKRWPWYGLQTKRWMPPTQWMERWWQTPAPPVLFASPRKILINAITLTHIGVGWFPCQLGFGVKRITDTWNLTCGIELNPALRDSMVPERFLKFHEVVAQNLFSKFLRLVFHPDSREERMRLGCRIVGYVLSWLVSPSYDFLHRETTSLIYQLSSHSLKSRKVESLRTCPLEEVLKPQSSPPSKQPGMTPLRYARKSIGSRPLELSELPRAGGSRCGPYRCWWRVSVVRAGRAGHPWKHACFELGGPFHGPVDVAARISLCPLRLITHSCICLPRNPHDASLGVLLTTFL